MGHFSLPQSPGRFSSIQARASSRKASSPGEYEKSIAMPFQTSDLRDQTSDQLASGLRSDHGVFFSSAAGFSAGFSTGFSGGFSGAGFWNLVSSMGMLCLISSSLITKLIAGLERLAVCASLMPSTSL